MPGPPPPPIMRTIVDLLLLAMFFLMGLVVLSAYLGDIIRWFHL